MFSITTDDPCVFGVVPIQYIALFPVVMAMTGSGLNNTRDPTAAVCRFTRNDQSMDEFTTSATPMGYHRLTCPLPPFNISRNFEG